MNREKEWEKLSARAEQDYKGFQILWRSQEIALPVSCYLAEQAIEKFLKATLSKKDIAFPYTHDLTELGALCLDHQLSLPVDIEELEKLNPSMLKQRYYLPPKIPVTRDELKSLVNLLVNWCKKELHG